MPSAHGEDAVVRILDKQTMLAEHGQLRLDALGFDVHSLTILRDLIDAPYGMLLVTGPTGSGKTTTLYATLSETHTGRDKVITIEDPVEYQLAGVLQIPVNEKKGLTFARGLRSILRHDPDKIMVGEIRDSETAQIAVQAALTGHQVFTTVHANNVFDVIGRFSNMGVDSYSLVAALTGIMAQRLVRTLCTECAQPRAGGGMKPVGCPACRGTGYKGRIAIAETLAIDDDMKDLLVQHAPISTIKRHARERGFRSLRDAAEALAARGATSLEEIDRVAPAE
jgi:general secretion pathway protein E